MNSASSNARKAAILVASLDPPTADQLLEQMGPEAAAQVRATMIELGDVADDEERDTIEEFLRLGSPLDEYERAGVELDPDLAARIADDAAADSPPVASKPTIKAPTFRCLQIATDEMLVRFLLREHPQTAALVLSRLAPQRAAEVLGRLPDQMQGDVLRRLSDLDEAASEVLLEIEQALQTWVDREFSEHRRRTLGRTAVQSILQAAQGDARQSLLNHISPKPAADAPPSVPFTAARRDVEPEPTDEPFTFDQLTRLDDRALIAVFRQANPDSIVLALAGAAPELVERISRQLSSAEAKALRKALRNIGPTRLSDMEQAQQSLADIAGELVAHRRRNRQVLPSAAA